MNAILMINALWSDRCEEWVESICKEFNELIVLDQGVFSHDWTEEVLE